MHLGIIGIDIRLGFIDSIGFLLGEIDTDIGSEPEIIRQVIIKSPVYSGEVITKPATFGGIQVKLDGSTHFHFFLGKGNC